MAKLNRSDDNDLLMALRHPLRRRILREMTGEKAVSPRQLSTGLNKPLSNISYHVRVLAECGAVTLVRTEPVRGSMQHFYRSVVEAPWAREILGIDADPPAAKDDEGRPGGDGSEDSPP